MSSDAIVDAALQRLGWQWGDAGIVLHLGTPHGNIRVTVPLSQVWAAFSQQFRFPEGIGCPHTAIGFWGAIKRAARSVSRAAKHTYKRVVPKRIQRAASRVHRVAQRALRTAHTAFTSDAAMYAMMGLAFVPGLTAPMAGALAAQQALRRIDVGRRAAAKMLAGAPRTLGMLRAVQQGDRAKTATLQALSAARSGQAHAGNFLNGLRMIGNF